MQRAALHTIIESIASMEGHDDLTLIEIAVKERRQKLLRARTNPCSYGHCHGNIVDDKCSGCGQTYVPGTKMPPWEQVVRATQRQNYLKLRDMQDKTIFKRGDGTWGWFDETWNDGDQIHYKTSEEASAAQLKYATEVLGI